MRLWILPLLVIVASVGAALNAQAKPGHEQASARESNHAASKPEAAGSRSSGEGEARKKGEGTRSKRKARPSKGKGEARRSKSKGKADKAKDDAGSASGSELFADILVLHATNSKKGIDPRIGAMPELSKPPFSAYSTYSLLKRARLPLKKSHRQQVDLPNGTGLRIELRERLGDDLVRLAAAITRPKGEEVLPLLEVKARVAQRFVVAGQSYKKGILVLVIRPMR